MNFTNFENLAFPGFDPATGTVTLPWWAVAAAAALLVVSWLLAVLRGGPAILVGSFVGVAFLALVVTIAWVGTERVAERERAEERLAERERAEERRALSARAQDLAREAAMPNSVLACLDGAVGETVEAGCERALFASPEAVAGATAYTTARLALLTDGADYAARRNASDEGALPGLRAALEADRFGFVAQVLASQYGCTADHCDVFTLFRDSKRIGANLRDRPFDLYVGKHAANWSTRRAPVLSASGASPVPPGFNLPSAASIPPVNIMVPEVPAASANAAAGETTATAAPPARRAAPRAARPAPASPSAPAQIAPPAANTGSAPRAQ
jgi:hypothetical protein